MLAACGGGGGSGGGSIPAGGSGPSSGGAVRPSVVEHGTGAQIIEFPITTGATVVEAPIIQSGGALWFLDSLGIGKVTTAGKFSQYTDTTYQGETLAAGPDGNVWFGAYNYIGHTLPNGTLQTFQLTGAVAPCLFGVTSTSKDKTGVWFADACNSAIGRIPTNATDGSSAVEYPTMLGGPFNIAAGPDGNLWFTEIQADAIGKSTTAGAIVEYPLTSSVMYYIPAGLISAGGLLWFPSYVTSPLITYGITGASVSGTAQFLANPSPWNGDGVGALAAGPDGNVWWVTGYPRVLDSATPSGTVVNANVPLGVDAYGLVTGPDKNLWFTDATNNSIDVYVMNPQTVTPTSIAFNMVGETQTFSASEGGSGTSLTVTSSNAKVASVAPAATLGSWTVTAVGAGTCNIKVADQNGNYTDIAVSVTTESFVVQ